MYWLHLDIAIIAMISKLQSVNPERLGIEEGSRQDPLREGNNKHFMSEVEHGRRHRGFMGKEMAEGCEWPWEERQLELKNIWVAVWKPSAGHWKLPEINIWRQSWRGLQIVRDRKLRMSIYCHQTKLSSWECFSYNAVVGHSKGCHGISQKTQAVTKK